jgi:hypothetical protein
MKSCKDCKYSILSWTKELFCQFIIENENNFPPYIISDFVKLRYQYNLRYEDIGNKCLVYSRKQVDKNIDKI